MHTGRIEEARGRGPGGADAGHLPAPPRLVLRDAHQACGGPRADPWLRRCARELRAAGTRWTPRPPGRNR
ncbi:hypothetical protein ACSHWO_28920 [Streptomyces sp. HUAS TT3]|uniref:hypothetical protein n=1 Tax=Streptomyces sp. HUAS TT3 TaxID=3447510 RepID=UPI003F659536